MCNVIHLVKKILSVSTCFTFLSETECPNSHYLLQLVFLKEVDNTPHPVCPSNVQLHFYFSSAYKMYLRNADHRNHEADCACDCETYKLS